MKKSLLILVFTLASTIAFANVNSLDALAKSPEVRDLIKSVETNRSVKCEGLSSDNTRISSDGAVQVDIACNQYDADGEPIPNVTTIHLRGNLSGGSYFELSAAKLISAE